LEIFFGGRDARFTGVVRGAADLPEPRFMQCVADLTGDWREEVAWIDRNPITICSPPAHRHGHRRMELTVRDYTDPTLLDIPERSASRSDGGRKPSNGWHTQMLCTCGAPRRIRPQQWTRPIGCAKIFYALNCVKMECKIR